jgi:hypothetical protein
VRVVDFGGDVDEYRGHRRKTTGTLTATGMVGRDAAIACG